MNRLTRNAQIQNNPNSAGDTKAEEMPVSRRTMGRAKTVRRRVVR